MFGGQIASTIDEADQLSGSSDEAAIQAIALATVDDLAERLGPTAKIAALGFSFGAAWAIWTPTRSDRLAATVVYYGTWVEDAVMAGSHVPVLGHFAEDDPYETAETVDAFEKGLKDAGREVTIYRYPGTGHWFAEPSKDAYRAEAADLAFERTVDFLTSWGPTARRPSAHHGGPTGPGDVTHHQARPSADLSCDSPLKVVVLAAAGGGSTCCWAVHGRETSGPDPKSITVTDAPSFPTLRAQGVQHGAANTTRAP